MKSIFALLALATASVVAQSNVAIPFPAAGTTFVAGSYITVNVSRMQVITPTIGDISVAIALYPCSSFGRKCGDIDFKGALGIILYAGPYRPTKHPFVKPYDFYETFNLSIPLQIASGPASLNVAHFAVVGPTSFPALDVQNITINIVAP